MLIMITPLSTNGGWPGTVGEALLHYNYQGNKILILCIYGHLLSHISVSKISTTLVDPLPIFTGYILMRLARYTSRIRFVF